MKRAVALLGLAWISGCSFDYQVVEQAGAGGGGSGGGSGSGGSSGSSGSSGMPPAPSCKDNERNGAETGVDCGMAACSKACPPGQGCDGDADCDGGKCQDKICRAASCGDGLQNSSESDVDCGGDQGCARCAPGRLCAATSDCDGGLCTNGQCQAPSCKDLLQNADETDIDCGGGACKPCSVGMACSKTDDCDGLACAKDTCQPAACDDGVLNQDETDVDCGGACDPCADTLKCKVAADCASGVCPKTLLCAVPTCSDKVQNGSEPSVDCGASCPKKCQVLDACGAGNDCQSTSCVNQRCLPLTATGQTLSPLNWTATASATLSTSTPAYAIDGLQSTDWISGANQVPGMWYMLDLGSDQVVFSLEMDVNQQDPDPTKSDDAAGLDIAFSENSSFTGVTPVIMNRAVADHEVIKFNPPQVGRYLKLSLSLGKDRWWRIDEIRLKQ